MEISKSSEGYSDPEQTDDLQIVTAHRSRSVLKHKVLPVLFCILTLLFAFHISEAQGDECCSRHAKHGKYTLNDPMGIVGSTEALQASVQNLLQELMTNECFHFIATEQVDNFVKDDIQNLHDAGKTDIWIPNDLPPIEYTFEAQFVSGLNEFTEEGRPIRSRLKVQMYFEGEQRELVHTWQTTGTWDVQSNSGTSWRGHANKFKKNYRAGPDIMEIVKKFEKKPVECKIKPEKEYVNPNEVIKIDLSGFKDGDSEDSREFNRILVHAYSGYIQNGEVCDMGPDYKAFRIKDGNLTIRYRAPENCDEPTDRITVYSSCDILPDDKVAMSKTNMYRRLLEKTLYINCFDASLVIRKKYQKNLRTSNTESRTSGSCTSQSEDKHSLNEYITAEIFIGLQQTESQDMPPLNQTFVYYKPVKVNITTFSYNSVEHKYNSSKPQSGNCAGGYETTIDYTRNCNNYKIPKEQYMTQSPWLVAFDNETEKAVKIIPAGYEMSYDVDETEKVESVRFSSNGGMKREENSSRKKFTRSFEVGPVGEEIDDPTIKPSNTWVKDYLKEQGIDLPAGIELPNVSNDETIKKIPPDIIVQNGNGKTDFGGSGHRTLRKTLYHGYSEEILNYEWHMRLKKKPQR